MINKTLINKLFNFNQAKNKLLNLLTKNNLISNSFSYLSSFKIVSKCFNLLYIKSFTNYFVIYMINAKIVVGERFVNVYYLIQKSLVNTKVLNNTIFTKRF